MPIPFPSVHSVPIARQYHAHGAGTSVLQLVGIFVCLVLPLLVVFATGNVWVKNFTYMEQPEVVYLNKALVVVQPQDTAMRPLVWSTMPATERIVGDSYFLPFVEHYSEDLNTDGTVDRMHFSVRLRLPEGFAPVGVDSIWFLDWKAKKELDVDMETAVSCTVSSPTSIRSAEVFGDLGWYQRNPLINNGFIRYDQVYAPSLFAEHLVLGPENLDVQTLQRRYAARNESTPLVVRSQSMQPSQPADHTLDFTLSVDVSPVTITYVPHIVVMLKFGLVQYFVLASLFTWLWSAVNGFLVEAGLVNTIARCPELDALERLHSRARMSY